MGAVLALVGLSLTVWLALRGIGTAPAAPPDLCVEQLPEPDRTKALAALAGDNVARLQQYAAQADARGWHCAAKAFRVRAQALTPTTMLSPVATATPKPTWPSGTVCEAALVGLPNDARKNPSGGVPLQGLRTIARQAIDDKDTKALRHVADLLRDPTFADAYKFAADCLTGHADDLDKESPALVVPAPGPAPAAAPPYKYAAPPFTSGPLFPMESA